MIFNASGCGTGLNLRVIAYPTDTAMLSAKPNSNTIGVITETEITSWVFSPNAPDVPSEGMLWIAVGISSPVEFNVLNTNSIVVCPIATYQSIGGKWIQKHAKTYIDETWTEWYTYLFNNGNVNESLTGGINGTIQDNVIYFNSNIEPSQCKSYTTINKVNLTNATIMKVVVTSPNTAKNAYFRVFVDETPYNGERVLTSNLVAYYNSESPFNNSGSPSNSEVREVALDVSALTGEYYLGYAWGVSSDATSSKTMIGSIERWWLE